MIKIFSSNKNGDYKKKNANQTKLDRCDDFLHKTLHKNTFLNQQIQSDERHMLIKYKNAPDSESGVNSLRASELQKRREIHSLLLFIFFLLVTIITLSQILVMHSSTNNANLNQIKLMQEELKLMDLSIDKMLKEKHVLSIQIWIALKKYNENIKIFSSYLENLDHRFFSSDQNISRCDYISNSSFFKNLTNNENIDSSNFTKILAKIDREIKQLSNQTILKCLESVILNLFHSLNIKYSNLHEQNYNFFAKINSTDLINETLNFFDNKSSILKNYMPIRKIDALKDKYQKNKIYHKSNLSLCNSQPPFLGKHIIFLIL